MRAALVQSSSPLEPYRYVSCPCGRGFYRFRNTARRLCDVCLDRQQRRVAMLRQADALDDHWHQRRIRARERLHLEVLRTALIASEAENLRRRMTLVTPPRKGIADD